MKAKILITIFIVLVVFVFLSEIWYDQDINNGHNICIGPKAGYYLTTESYEFRLKTDPNEPELYTKMTPEEYEVIKGVLDRLEQVPILESTIKAEYDKMCKRIDETWLYTDEQMAKMKQKGICIGKYPLYHSFREAYLSNNP